MWKGDVRQSGKREILFKSPRIESGSVFQLKLPCGQCIGCRLERSRQWAMRCVHEASLYEDNCFITLTYGDSCLPVGGGLRLRDFQLFMKRLRKVAGRDVKYFHCGEYGELCELCGLSKKLCRCRQFVPGIGRPHFHACLFNYDFRDKYFFRKSERGDKLYRSATLEALWTAGQSMIGAVTFESAAYVARYVMKKISISEKSDDRVRMEWQRKYVDERSGEIRDPEYVTMSRRPGIGHGWYDKFKSDIFPRDYAIMRGVKVGVPKFYDGLYELEDPEGFLGVKRKRVCSAFKVDPTGFGETGDARLRVKEEVKRAQIRSLSRTLEV